MHQKALKYLLKTFIASIFVVKTVACTPVFNPNFKFAQNINMIDKIVHLILDCSRRGDQSADE